MNITVGIFDKDDQQVHPTVTLPMTVAMSYGMAMLEAALKEGHTVRIAPAPDA
jgi:hypothetical protein